MSVTDAIRRILYCNHHNPYEVLGHHPITTETGEMDLVRAFEPGATELYLISSDHGRKPVKMTPLSEQYVFEITSQSIPRPYKLKAVYENGRTHEFYDPYAFPGTLTDFDLYLFSQGVHQAIYEKMGAHPVTIQGVQGVCFSVWAPNAVKVSVIGDFNYWDGRKHQMRVLGHSGVWEMFIPELKPGTIYKYEIKTREGHLYQKSDPYAYAAELRPKTASVVADSLDFDWQDQQWIARRASQNPLTQPISVYEVHLGSWMRVPEENDRFMTYRELAPKLAAYVAELGYTHIELLPVCEHPLDISWGYQVTGYYAPTARFGSPQDFMYFVNYLHARNIGVIMDWVPAHFPRDPHALSYFDGTFLYEHEDDRKREHKDWGTLIFNYGRNEVRNFLMANALFWIDIYHLDGLRVDAVASMLYLDYSRKPGEWVPNAQGGRENLEAIEFIKQTNEIVFSKFPGVMMMAEESTAWMGVSRPTYVGGLGYNFKWNMGWMNDTLRYVTKETIHRRYHQSLLTFSLLYAFHENFMLSISHDEVVHGKRSLLDKMPGDMWQKMANLRSFWGYMFGHPGKKLMFMGQDFGQWNEWNCETSLDWHLTQYAPHQQLQACMRDLNRLYRTEPALYEVDYGWEGFEWIDFTDADNSVLTFIRWGNNYSNPLIFVCNFTPVPRCNYRIGVPFQCEYKEVFNSDSALYGGSNLGNAGGFWADALAWQDRPASLNLTLPPLATIVLKPV